MSSSKARSAAAPRRALGVWLGALALLVPASARAEHEVRIAIVQGPAQVKLTGERLAAFDGVLGERLAWSRGAAEVTVSVDGKGVRGSGSGLSLDAGKRLQAERLVFEAPDGVRVEGRLYLGRISVRPSPAGRGVLVINRLPLETYLLGIVGSEMSPAWPNEALKAQAVAARTYAMQRRMRMRSANKPYDLESTVLSQVYKGADRIRPSVVRAVSETRGEVLAFKHRLVEAVFHSTCGGHTLSAADAFGNGVAYLQRRDCDWCRPSERFRWKKSFPVKAVEAKLSKAGLIRGRLSSLESRAEGGPVIAKAGGRTVQLEPKAVRKAIGYFDLSSARFAARTDGASIRFEGRGFGHGAGMCQWGARGQSLEGRGYDDILAHYYSGARLHRLY